MPSALTWPVRRRLTAAAAGAAVLVLLTSTAPPSRPGAWWAATVAAAALAGLVVASYVPRRGLRPDFGCSPCAALAGLLAGYAVLGALGRTDAATLLLALVMLAVALGQRLRDVRSCPV